MMFPSEVYPLIKFNNIYNHSICISNEVRSILLRSLDLYLEVDSSSASRRKNVDKYRDVLIRIPEC